MDHDTRRSFDTYLAQRTDHPFGDVKSVSGRTLQPFSFAGQQGARNLLDKASRALGEGDFERSRALVDRAVRLPFDAHEQAAPAAMAAHMVLFCLVTDTLEQADADDARWLDAAVEVLVNADEAARYDMRDVLVAIDQDYALEPSQRSRIRSAVAVIPDRAELRDLNLDPTELGVHIMAILTACGIYLTALQEG